MTLLEMDKRILPEKFDGEFFIRNPAKAQEILQKVITQINAQREELEFLMKIADILQQGYDRYGWLKEREGREDSFREIEIKFRDREETMIILQELGKRYRGPIPQISLNDRNLKKEICQCGHTSVVLEVIERWKNYPPGQVKGERQRRIMLKIHCGRIEIKFQE